jgi:D-proline reductase (dithiol) PrdB
LVACHVNPKDEDIALAGIGGVHNYFDHRDALKDLNCVFPLERLPDLEGSGYIGKFAPIAIALGMGRLYKRTALQKETTPKIMDPLKKLEADAALLVAA